MAIMNVNPTRMELSRLKKRLAVARRGHKLLKDKRDELMKKFLELVKKDKDLREKTDEMMMNVHLSFLIARSVMQNEVLEEALMFPKQAFLLDVQSYNILNVNVPKFNFKARSDEFSDIYPYGFANTSCELDNAITTLSDLLPYLFELTQIEKSVQLLAEEIEKTRRRVNALEYVLIPQLTETIKYIKMKLDENERGNLTRLMKVKDMMIEKSRKSIKLVVPIILSVLLISGCSFSKKNDEVLLPPLEIPQQIQYSTLKVQKGNIRKEIKDTATIDISSGKIIYSEFGGRLKGLYVSEGDVVKKGDLLAEFESDGLEIKLEQSKINVEKAKINKSQSIAQAENEIEIANVELERLKQELNIKEVPEELLSIGDAAAQKSYNEEIEKLNDQIKEQEYKIETLKEKLEIVKITADLDIETSERSFAQVEKELANTKIVSPIDGIVYNVSKMIIGEQISAYSPMLTIIKPENVQIKYSGYNARYFEVGMGVEVFIGENELKGKVVVAPSNLPQNVPESSKENVLIRVEGLSLETITEKKGNIRLNLILEERNDVIVIPKRLIQNYLGNRYVYVLENGEKLQRFVEVGIETNSESEIIKGLNEGELLIEA